MKLCRSITEFRDVRRKLNNGTVGFVPTMGGLHDGHMQLVRASKAQCMYTVVSVFLNPTQFSADEDLDSYPRTLADDIKLLDGENVDVVLLPSDDEMYPNDCGRDAAMSSNGTFVEVRGRSKQLEGVYRPHFFMGVATVVCKLLNIVQPDDLFMGKKDGQQCVVIANLLRDLCYDVRLHVIPTMRESNGLAMSSRNAYLKDEETSAAAIIYRALNAAAALFNEGTTRKASVIINKVHSIISEESRCSIQYVALSDRSTLADVEEIGEDGAMLSGGFFFGQTRLIDNIVIGGN